MFDDVEVVISQCKRLAEEITKPGIMSPGVIQYTLDTAALYLELFEKEREKCSNSHPSLITLEEMGKDRWPMILKKPVWVEHNTPVRNGGWAFVADQTKTYLNFQFEPLIGPGHFKKSGYNKEWRMWTDEPTEEQRKAVPWEYTRWTE